MSMDGSELQLFDTTRRESEMVHFDLVSDEYNDERILFMNTFGIQLKSIPVTNEDFDVRKEGGIQFSPLDDNLIALPFEFTNEDRDRKKYVTVWNWRSDTVLATFNDREYIDPMWTPDGQLLIWDRQGGLYQVSITDEAVSEPLLLFRAPEPVSFPALSHDGTRLVFSMARHLWICNRDGSGLIQLTAAREEGLEISPEWSPDDRFILLKAIDDGDELKDGALWIVAANADHVRLDRHARTAMPLTDRGGEHLRYIYGTLTWR
jgi:Tol biopolymer transport system component